jgi:xanthine dehydrogenase accessory factor
MEPALLREAATLAERGVACALAVVVETRGSVPGKVGATMLVTADGTSRGTVGGAGLEERVRKLCRDALAAGRGGVHAFDLANWKEDGLDSVCGGTVTVAISVVDAVPHLLLVGGGHCAQALARLCDHLGYGYTVVDSRPAFASEDLFPKARAVLCGDPADFIRLAEDLSAFSHCYLLGHSHHEDGAALVALLERGFPGVIGVIGSRSKMRAFRERAAERGIPEGAFARVRSPIGVDVGARTPAEIGVAVAAEIIHDLRKAAPRSAAERRTEPFP